MMKHYTHYLPEAGQITKKGDAISYLHLRIQELSAQIKNLYAEIATDEQAIYELARTEWLPEEIREAKLQAEKESPLIININSNMNNGNTAEQNKVYPKG